MDAAKCRMYSRLSHACFHTPREAAQQLLVGTEHACTYLHKVDKYRPVTQHAGMLQFQLLKTGACYSACQLFVGACPLLNNPSPCQPSSPPLPSCPLKLVPCCDPHLPCTNACAQSTPPPVNPVAAKRPIIARTRSGHSGCGGFPARPSSCWCPSMRSSHKRAILPTFTAILSPCCYFVCCGMQQIKF